MPKVTFVVVVCAAWCSVVSAWGQSVCGARQPEAGTAEPAGAPAALAPANAEEHLQSSASAESPSPAPVVEIAIETVQLSYARADDVAKILSTIVGDDLRLAVDERTNTLVIAIAPDKYPPIARLVQRLDVHAEPEIGFIVTPVRLHAVSAEVVESKLAHLLGKAAAVRFIADHETNTLWLAGTQDRVASVRQTVCDMDTLAEAARAKPPANARRLVLHPLKHADAVRLASVLTSALGSSRGIRFAGDPASQTLIVYASPSEDAELTTLIDRLDVPPREAAQ